MSRLEPPRALILGLSGPDLGAREADRLAEADPWGVILFARNVETPERLAALIADIRETLGRWVPILIDQEGGRVRRLRPPLWPDHPPMAAYGALYRADAAAARRAIWLGGRALAADLLAVGIDVVCAPMLDVPAPDSHAGVIGDRALHADPAVVAELGRIAMEAYQSIGIRPVIKHLPGHGRARVDSHHRLPTIDAAIEALIETDLLPFRVCNDAPLAMTAHIVVTAVDALRPATQSPTVIDQLIRKTIGFEGLLMSDDLAMEALSGSLHRRAEESLAAGCDLVMHCTGAAMDARILTDIVPRLSGTALARARWAMTPKGTLTAAEVRADAPAWRAERDRLLAPVWQPAAPVPVR